MMLTSTFSMPPQQQYYAPYTPSRSSPLSERSVNQGPRIFDFTMSSHANDKKPSIQQRAYKPNPLLQTRDAATKRRRDMFFKRVQNSREDKKWEARGERIQQLDHISERRRWEADKARQAPEIDDFEDEQLEDFDSDLPTYALQDQDDMTEAEYIATQEEYELQRLIASMERDQENDTSSQHFGSDDEDYDALFMECANMADQQCQQQQSSTYDTIDAMDMEMTDA